MSRRGSHPGQQREEEGHTKNCSPLKSARTLSALATVLAKPFTSHPPQRTPAHPPLLWPPWLGQLPLCRIPCHAHMMLLCLPRLPWAPIHRCQASGGCMLAIPPPSRYILGKAWCDPPNSFRSVLMTTGWMSHLPTHPHPQEKETQTVKEINTVKSYKSEKLTLNLSER